MITARATGQNGEEIILLGVSRANVDKLVAGYPIHVTAETHPGFPEKLVIVLAFGETERAIADQMRPLLDPDKTKIVAVPKSHPAPDRKS